MAKQPETIPADGELRYAQAKCPHCGQTDLVPVVILPRLVTLPEESKLGVKVAQKAQDHKCGQTTLTVVAETGEVIQLDLDS